jgi:hypothetical protein
MPIPSTKWYTEINPIKVHMINAYFASYNPAIRTKKPNNPITMKKYPKFFIGL